MSKIEIKIGTATCGNAAGAQKTLAKILELTKGNDDIIVRETGCIGLCHAEPIVEVKMNGEKSLYGDVDDKKFEEIFESHIKNGKPVEANIKNRAKADEEYKFHKQTRIVLRNAGVIDPKKLEDYIARGGYTGIKNALATTPENVIQTVLDSGLRGRGGALHSKPHRVQAKH